ncbi:MAG: glycosyltransferase [Acidobacteriia bacterium]|nr:glycosyltransferase [Terriglobia bacterium]
MVGASRAEVKAVHELPPPPAGKTGWPWDTAVRCLPPKMRNGEAWPKISIVTPAYKQGNFLEETMRSVLLQGYPNLEYIVIDDGSPDNTAEIIRKYESHLAYWTTQKNSGQPTAINNGFAHATGEIMGWLNSDDLLLPRALERIAQAHCDPRVKVTCGFRKVIDADSRVTELQIHPWPAPYDLMRTCFVAQETVFWKREVWKKTGPLGNWRYALDFDYWHRVITNGYKFTLLPYFLGALRMHPECKTSRMRDVCAEEAAEIFERFLGRRLTLDEAWSQSTLHTQYRMFRKLPRSALHSRLTAVPVLKAVSAMAHWLRHWRQHPPPMTAASGSEQKSS